MRNAGRRFEGFAGGVEDAGETALDSPSLKDTLRMGLHGSGQQGQPVIAVDYDAVLLRAIEASRADPGKLRSAIYDIARVNLHREILWQHPAISDAELRVHLLALEDAIDRIEASHRPNYDNGVFRSEAPLPQLEELAETPVPAGLQRGSEDSQAFETPQPIDVSHMVELLDVAPLPRAEPQSEAAFATEAEWQPVHSEPVQEFESPVYDAGSGDTAASEPASNMDWDAGTPVKTHAASFADTSDSEVLHSDDSHRESRGEVVILAPEPPMAMQSGPMLRVAPNVIVDPPPRKWSDLKYVFWHQGGPLCRGSITSLKRSSRSCVRWMFLCPKARTSLTPSARSA